MIEMETNKKKNPKAKLNNAVPSNPFTKTRNSVLKNLELTEYNEKIKQDFHNTILFATYPWVGWVIGLLMIIAGGYLIYHISLGKYGSLFSEFREG